MQIDWLIWKSQYFLTWSFIATYEISATPVVQIITEFYFTQNFTTNTLAFFRWTGQLHGNAFITEMKEKNQTNPTTCLPKEDRKITKYIKKTSYDT